MHLQNQGEQHLIANKAHLPPFLGTQKLQDYQVNQIVETQLLASL